MGKYKALFFDLDDTLLAFEPTETAALKALHHKYYAGLYEEATIIQTYRTINRAIWGKVDQGLKTVDEARIERFEEMIKSFKDFSLNSHELATFFETQLGESSVWINDAKDIYQILKNHYKIAIVTNGLTHVQKQRCEIAGISYDTLVVAQALGINKPHKGIFEHALNKLQVKAEEVLMIGDGLSSDYLGALNSNIDFCWYNPKKLPLEENYSRPKFIIHDIKELGTILQNSYADYNTPVYQLQPSYL